MGPETDPVRQLMRAYLGAAIASTWRQEAPPPGDYYPKNLARTDFTENLDDVQLDRMLNQAGTQ